MIGGLLGMLFGGGRNAVAETVELFRENAERGAERDSARSAAALNQYAAEFSHSRRSWFDALIDGMNRVPRPAMAIGTLGLFVSAMVDPIWFAERMTGIALVPEPLWWLLGAIVSFYFGSRYQAKSQDFQRSIADSLARAPQVTEGLRALRALEAGAATVEPAVSAAVAEPSLATSPAEPGPATEAHEPPEVAQSISGPNPALTDWRRSVG